MSRLQARFSSLKASGRKALIPYVTAGDPSPEYTVSIMHACVAAGADVLELGVPFSDPMADGPVIQAACERALAHSVTLTNVLDMVRTFREQDQDTPVVLMGYCNPVEVTGYEKFSIEAADAGVDGVLTVDMPPEEGKEAFATMRKHGLDPVFLIAPTSTEDRLRAICAEATGFVYYVSLKGVTGSASLDVDSVAAKVAEIRGHTDLPVGVGFGISDGASAAAVAAVSDAVIIGSAMIQSLQAVEPNEQNLVQAAKGFLGDIRAALDAA